MTFEMNLFSVLSSSKNPIDFSNNLMLYGGFLSTNVWTIHDQPEFLISESLKSIIPIEESVVGQCIINQQDLILGDPSNHPGFSIVHDLPLLRGVEALGLLPIFNHADKVIAILQIAQNTSFNSYTSSLVKLIRDLLTKLFYKSLPTFQIPSESLSLFTDIDKSSITLTASYICKFLQTSIKCEMAEIYELNGQQRTMIRLTDSQVFSEEEDKVVFNCIKQINYPHGYEHGQGPYGKKSLFVKSMRQGSNHYILALRGKMLSQVFTPEDIQLVSNVTPLICSTLKLVKWLESEKIQKQNIQNQISEHHCLGDILNSIASNSDPYQSLLIGAKALFDCETFFYCIFDGRNMCYHPLDIKLKFEDCLAGRAFNYRQGVWFHKQDNQNFERAFYNNVGLIWRQSFAFPYKAGGKVIGAIEIINPQKTEISIESQTLFGNLCGCLLNPKKFQLP